MANAISNLEHLAYGKESTWGTTPVGAAASQFLRFTGVNSKNDKTTVESAELTNSSEVADIIQVAQRGGLSFNSELSYGNLDDLLASIFANPWSANVLTVAQSRQPISFERQFSDVGRFWVYAGGLVSQLQINVAIGKILTASVTVDSKPVVDASSSAFSGGGTIAAPANSVMDPINFLQLAQEGGAGSIVGLTELQISLARSVIDMAQVGSINPLDMQNAQFVASGYFSCYFADATYIAKHLSHVASQLSFTLGSAGTKNYSLVFSKVRLTLADIPNPGINQPLIQKVEWKAYKDATNGTCKITRTP